jgi:hypothetical protein
MNLCKFSGMMILVVVLVCVSSRLPAVGTTTQPAGQNDLDQAQQALQRLMEQSPPVTTPTVPTGTNKPDTNSRVQPPPQVFSPLNKKVPQTKWFIGRKIYPEGYYIADRRGRLVKGKEYWTFVFESDGKALSDPPIRILPNRWLEKMESDLASEQNSLVFQVSGEITVYNGENYVLLRKVLIERDLSNNFK